MEEATILLHILLIESPRDIRQQKDFGLASFFLRVLAADVESPVPRRLRVKPASAYTLIVPRGHTWLRAGSESGRAGLLAGGYLEDRIRVSCSNGIGDDKSVLVHYVESLLERIAGIEEASSIRGDGVLLHIWGNKIDKNLKIFRQIDKIKI